MSAAFTFGSFGDIATVLQLAWQLRAALDDATGACAKIRSLTADVDVFIDALQNIQTFVERQRKTLRPDVINGLCAALGRCRDLLRSILQKIKRAEARFSGSTWQKHWGSAAWSILGSKKAVDSLRQLLIEQINIIQLYLGLSQAQEQTAIANQLDHDGATLERVCGVLQEIQVRFDVGIPSFQFFDEDTRTYYAPVARTSLQRLNDILMAAGDQDIRSTLESRGEVPWDEVLDRVESKTPVRFRLCDLHINCMFFKEAAFGQWQVLVASRPRLHSFSSHLKTLLERRHTVGEACNCQGGNCSAPHEDYRRHYDISHLYPDAARLLVDILLKLDSEHSKLQLAAIILAAFKQQHAPDFVRAVWVPIVRLSRPPVRPQAALELLLAAPSISISTDPLWIGLLCRICAGKRVDNSSQL